MNTIQISVLRRQNTEGISEKHAVIFFDHRGQGISPIMDNPALLIRLRQGDYFHIFCCLNINAG